MVKAYDAEGREVEVTNPSAFVAGSVETLEPHHPAPGEPGGPVIPTDAQLAIAAKRVRPGSPGTRWDPLSRTWVVVSTPPSGKFEGVERPGPEGLAPANPTPGAPTLVPLRGDPSPLPTVDHRPGPPAMNASPKETLQAPALAAATPGMGHGGPVVAPTAPPTAGKVFVRRGYSIPTKTRIFPNPRK
jgi:hypothetical protein